MKSKKINERRIEHMTNRIELSKIIDDVVLIDENGNGISRKEFREHIEEGWLGYYLALPITNSIVEYAAIVTARHRDHYNDALGEAVESFETYRKESLSEDELAMLGFQEIVS